MRVAMDEISNQYRIRAHSTMRTISVSSCRVPFCWFCEEASLGTRINISRTSRGLIK